MAPYTSKQDWKRLLRAYHRCSLKLRTAFTVVYEQNVDESIFATVLFESRLIHSPRSTMIYSWPLDP